MITSEKLIIAGPCSAENRTQVLDTAQSISQIDQSIIYRAGIWKPRTTPGCFEGIGRDALPWLSEVKSEFGLKTAVEVATPEHIEDCFKNDVDILWIGARTTGNPFAIQEIAEALQGHEGKVLVKNPIHQDIKLWIGAFQRLERCGVENTIAIHRGFHDVHDTVHRNAPQWRILEEFRRLMPETKVICDPSHIAGNRLLVPSVAEKAMSRNLDGLMIETHCNPEEALSDKNQQITPNQLGDLLSYLFKGEDDLEYLRQKIDFTDERLIELIGQRMTISEEIANYKQKQHIEVYQPHRWEKVQERNEKLAFENNLDPKFIRVMYNMIHDASIRKQRKITD